MRFHNMLQYQTDHNYSDIIQHFIFSKKIYRYAYKQYRYLHELLIIDKVSL